MSSYNEKIALQIKDLLFSGDQSSENNSRRTILSSLLSIQDKFGYIPEIAIETIATYMNVRYNTCLGACAQGPVISIDGQLKGKLKGDTAVNLVKKLKEISN